MLRNARIFVYFIQDKRVLKALEQEAWPRDNAAAFQRLASSVASGENDCNANTSHCEQWL